MSTASIRLDAEIVDLARVEGPVMGRTPPQQIEYWARVGRTALENPDLPVAFILDIQLGLAEVSAGRTVKYERRTTRKP